MIKWLYAGVLCMLLGCNSKNAFEYRSTIEAKRTEVFRMLVGENAADGGFETEKNECLLKRDFDCALNAVEKEEKVFDKILSDWKQMEPGNLKQGEELKMAGISYFEKLRQLYISEKEEVMLRASLDKTTDNAIIDSLQDKMLTFSKRKLESNKRVMEKSELLQNAIREFDSANGL